MGGRERNNIATAREKTTSTTGTHTHAQRGPTARKWQGSLPCLRSGILAAQHKCTQPDRTARAHDTCAGDSAPSPMNELHLRPRPAGRRSRAGIQNHAAAFPPRYPPDGDTASCTPTLLRVWGQPRKGHRPHRAPRSHTKATLTKQQVPSEGVTTPRHSTKHQLPPHSTYSHYCGGTPAQASPRRPPRSNQSAVSRTCGSRPQVALR